MKLKCVFIAIAVIIIDFFTKLAAVNNLKFDGEIVVIDNFFRLIYVENRGAAFGIMQDGRIFFIVLTLAVLIGLFYELKRYEKFLTTGLYILIGLFLGGTFGNFIDRVRQGYVVDFLSFNILGYKFPVFNVADIAITLSVVIFAVLLFTRRIDFDE